VRVALSWESFAIQMHQGIELIIMRCNRGTHKIAMKFELKFSTSRASVVGVVTQHEDRSQTRLDNAFFRCKLALHHW
jgi:hypothetical protein